MARLSHLNLYPGFQGESRRRVRSLVKSAGGTYSGDLVAGRTHILVQANGAVNQPSQKASKAASWDIPIVCWSWLAASQAAGARQSLNSYLCQPNVEAPGAKADICRILEPPFSNPRQALRDTTNIHLDLCQRAAGKKQKKSALALESVPALQDSTLHIRERIGSCRQNDFEPPDVELSRRAVTTRQGRSWRSSLTSTSSAEDRIATTTDRSCKPANTIARPPSPSGSQSSAEVLHHSPCVHSLQHIARVPSLSASTSGTRNTAAESCTSDSNSGSHGSPVWDPIASDCSLLQRELLKADCLAELASPGLGHPADTDATLPSPPFAQLSSHAEQAPARMAIALSVPHLIQDHHAPASVAFPIKLASEATPSCANQVARNGASTAPQPKRPQLLLESLTSRHGISMREHAASGTACSALVKLPARCAGQQLPQLPQRAPAAITASSNMASSSSSPGASSPGESAASAAAAAAAATWVSANSCPSDGKVQPLRMLARPPRGNTVRAFHGLKHIKAVPFAELLQLQVNPLCPRMKMGFQKCL